MTPKPDSTGFFRHADSHRHRTALILSDDTEISYGALLDRVHRISRVLRQEGLRRGDGVAAVLPNVPDYLALQLAADQLGLYFTPVNRHLTAGKVGYVLSDSGAAVVVTAPRFAGVTAEAADLAGMAGETRLCFGPATGFIDLDARASASPPTAPEERSAGAVQFYSSGTTGKPKGIKRPLPDGAPENVYAQIVRNRSEQFGLRVGDEVSLAVAPLYHSAPNMTAISSLHMGHVVVLAERFDAEKTLQLIEKHGVTTGFVVPTMFHRMLALPEEVRRSYDLSSLRVLTHSGASCPIEVKQAVLDWLGPVLYEYYGATETGAAVLCTPQEWREHPGTVGRVVPGYDVKILDEHGEEQPPGAAGEIYIKGGPSFAYRGKEAETAHQWRGEHFAPGDVGYFDDAGWLYMCDRRTDLIISGGVNIYPAEIEAVLLSHPAVADAGVIGIPDPEWGHRVVAVVEPKDDAGRTRLAAELVDHCRKHLAGFKNPGRIEFAPLPRTPTGKLSRSRLREAYLANAAGSTATPPDS
ncbi:AMP-binding protein [Saccharopolyspora elongata]|uniref:Acyl-CoA synthetase n=1 Tax=Saccharopolyspora elongata TaxID=2530387 RepID=A0A4R4YD38_9PSEU|nr:AMP-binding protein [Saccharopolyspora elongata]TDD42446.1 acyl-CoA synthetase [Saccharopolyspora elongata]